MSNALSDLAEAGVSVWLDDLSRPLIETGSLAKLVNDGEIVGITTNPTIFAKAIGTGSGYEGPASRPRIARHDHRRNTAAPDRMGCPRGMRCPPARVREYWGAGWSRFDRS